MKQIGNNSKARYQYTILDKYEAGIVLTGTEVKSLRTGKVSFVDSYCLIKKNEVYINKLHIPPYDKATYDNHDPVRLRKLLVHKYEIEKMATKINEKGYTLVPLNIYFNSKNKVKLTICLAKGKRLYDKRDQIKKRDVNREHKIYEKYGLRN